MSALAKRRDFLVSIRPNYAEKIVMGTKTVELRRRFTENVDASAKILIYSTSPIRAIIGYAEIKEVKRLKIADLWLQYGAAACINKHDFDAYFSGTLEGYAIELTNVHSFSNTIAAADLKEEFGFVAPQSFMYLPQEYYKLLNDERTETLN